MTRVNLTQNPPLDPYVLLDTSVLLAGYVSGHSKNSTANAFLKYAAAEFSAGRSQLFVADIGIEEAAHFICMKGLRRDIARNTYPTALKTFLAKQPNPANAKFGPDDLYKEYPSAIVPHVADVRAFITTVRSIPVSIIEPDWIDNPGFALVDRMCQYMDQFELKSADAYHIATASAIGATMLVSFDKDWLRADTDFTILYG